MFNYHAKTLKNLKFLKVSFSYLLVSNCNGSAKAIHKVIILLSSKKYPAVIPAKSTFKEN